MSSVMQSFFRLPWCNEHTGPKDTDMAAFEKMRANPVVEIPVFNKLKRKRTGSPEPTAPLRVPHNKKQRSDGASAQALPSTQTPPQPESKPQQTFTRKEDAYSESAIPKSQATQPSISDPGHDALKPSLQADASLNMHLTLDTVARPEQATISDAQQLTSDAVTGFTPLQQVIENEFNMQILMKHNELRLIDQELAKCQIALEQLRRVELRPYPGSKQPVESVSTGTGPALAPPPGYTRPSQPAPYGVTDGPYSRHYRHWLLQDSEFDSYPMRAQLNGDINARGRSTRNSGSVRKSISKPFVFLGRPSESMQSIPNYPVITSKDKSAPLILKRSTDQQLVKLICNNCLRGNFSSIQGFLNHCRIAHKVDYKSHDLAAIDCGRVLDEQEAANLPPDALSTPVHKPSVSRTATAPASSATATPIRSTTIHPWNTAAGVPASFGKPQNGAQRKRKAVSSLGSAARKSAGAPFIASAEAPRLSAHFAKHRLGGDLATAMANAKQKIDLGVDDEAVMSPDTAEQTSPTEPIIGGRTVPGMTGTNGVARPSSRKGFRMGAEKPRPSPLAPTPMHGSMQQEHSEIPESPPYPSSTFSPHTADSNPGLVSDHEDDDEHASASEEEEAPQPEMPRPFAVRQSCADNMEIDDVAVDDEVDRDGFIIRRNGIYTDEERGLRTVGSPSRKLGVSKRSN